MHAEHDDRPNKQTLLMLAFQTPIKMGGCGGGSWSLCRVFVVAVFTLKNSVPKTNRFRSRWNRLWPVVVRDSAPGRRTNQGGRFRLDYFRVQSGKTKCREKRRDI